MMTMHGAVIGRSEYVQKCPKQRLTWEGAEPTQMLCTLFMAADTIMQHLSGGSVVHQHQSLAARHIGMLRGLDSRHWLWMMQACGTVLPWTSCSA